VLYVAEERTAGGRLFHALGPETANARSPIVQRYVAGMMRSVDDADRRRRRAVSPTGVASSVKYIVALFRWCNDTSARTVCIGCMIALSGTLSSTNSPSWSACYSCNWKMKTAEASGNSNCTVRQYKYDNMSAKYLIDLRICCLSRLRAEIQVLAPVIVLRIWHLQYTASHRAVIAELLQRNRAMLRII